MNTPLERLKYHVTGAIERGEAEPIFEVRNTQIDLSGLVDDGDMVELPDGRSLRLRIEPDDSYSINDYDSDGKISQTFDYLHDGHQQRPEGFDGKAVKIEVGRGYWAWWQPCDGAVYETREDFQKDRRRIEELAQFGFVGLIVELCDGKDAYGQPIVVKSESLWGNEPDAMRSDYGHELVADLVAEVLS